MDGRQPRVFVPTSSFWFSRSQKVGDGTESGGWAAVNHVRLCEPPLSGAQGPRRWGLGQNLGVGRPSTTCVCANLHYLVLKVREGEGWDRIWGLDGRQPRAFVPTSTIWSTEPETVFTPPAPIRSYPRQSELPNPTQPHELRFRRPAAPVPR